MTVFEASTLLYSWFSENDSFSIEKDFMGVVPITESPNRDKAALECALKDFETTGILKSSSINDQIWVLKKPFHQYNQNVEVTPDVCVAIAGIVNNFCEAIDNDKDKCNPSDINEDDIKNLIYITNHLIEEKKIDLNGEVG